MRGVNLIRKRRSKIQATPSPPLNPADTFPTLFLQEYAYLSISDQFA